MYLTPWLPRSVLRSLNAASISLLNPPGVATTDFAHPLGEAALLPSSSLSWRVFKNPVALFIGGVAAVILELAQPAVRAAIWERSSFRKDPVGRLQRTGLAAMVTVYGARSIAEPMIARVVRMHGRVTGGAREGIAYSAADPRLLTWVNATAAFGFGQAYSQYVEPLKTSEMDILYAESATTARLYGALDSPASSRELDASFDRMRSELSPSVIIFQFLEMMRKAAAFPKALQWMQPLCVRAAVDLIPGNLRLDLGLTDRYGLRRWDRAIVKLAGTFGDRIVLSQSPASQSCLRLGFPADHLYVHR